MEIRAVGTETRGMELRKAGRERIVQAAMNDLTDGQAEDLGRVNAIAALVDNSLRGL